MSISIRRLVTADLGAAGAILDGAYGPGRRIVERVPRYLALDPDGWIIADVDGAPAGMAGAVRYDAFAYIGLVGVLPSAQRRGLGRALMEHLMARLERDGYRTILLDASDAGAPLYGSLGFVDEDTTRIFAAVDAPAAGGEDASRAPGAGGACEVRPFDAGDLDDVLAFDRPAFGADRRAAIASLLADFGRRSVVARDARGTVSGYAIAQAKAVGPWVAADAATAGALLRPALAAGFPEADDGLTGAIVPGSNAEAEGVLAANGLAFVRALRHMRYGAPAPRRRDLVYGQADMTLG